MDIDFGGSASEIYMAGKVVCAMDQHILQYINEKTNTQNYLEGCVEVDASERLSVRNELGEELSYERLSADEMTSRLKISAPFHRYLPIATVKEDLLKTVANALHTRVEYLSQKTEFVLFKAESGPAHAEVKQEEIKLLRFAGKTPRVSE